MDNLKCNILTCRVALTDKAVVTTCSHIFCVECANSQFNDSRLCPACETSLTEPDDVVVCSLHPTNDYKTSVLSGLNPATVLEICNRAMSFWQYQMHQELSFQQTVLRTVNDKSAYLQKELDNAVREARGQLSLLNNKLNEVERDLDLERRKTATLQDSLKDREKEYQKLKIQFDKIKRRALLAPGGLVQTEPLALHSNENQPNRPTGYSHSARVNVDVGAVVGDMNANGIQRTPIASRTTHQVPSWRLPAQIQSCHNPNAMNGGYGNNTNRSFRTNTTISEPSENEVENLIGSTPRRPLRSNEAWTNNTQVRSNQRHSVFAQQRARKTQGGFRPAGMPG